MTSAYMSLKTLAATLDMPVKDVEYYVARGMLPQPHRIGDDARWCWHEVEAWIRKSQSGTVEDDPFLEALRDGEKAEAPAARPHHQEQDGQTVHVLPTLPRHRKRRTESSPA